MILELMVTVAMTAAPIEKQLTARGPQGDLAGTLVDAGKATPVVLIIPGQVALRSPSGQRLFNGCGGHCDGHHQFHDHLLISSPTPAPAASRRARGDHQENRRGGQDNRAERPGAALGEEEC